MIPVIALVGRPNVGKSTLFNRLTRSRDALVADYPGLTRDRKYGDGKLGDHPYVVVDTGGLSGGGEGIDVLMAHQAWLAVEEADVVLFLVDGREGLSAADQSIAERLRRFGKPVYLVVNKTEGLDVVTVSAEFHALGLGQPWGISAAHGQGVSRLMNDVLEQMAREEAAEEGAQEEPEEDQGIRIAVVGRPNVGKSTLVNRMIGEDRVLAFDLPGTTRDAIFVPFERHGRHYTLIDTAGVRRRARVKETIEKFSVVKALQAIEAAHVVILVLDAREGITEQDASLAGFVMDTGRALVVAVNKWDGLEPDHKDRIRRELDIKLPFLSFAELLFISALHGTGVGKLLKVAEEAYVAANRNLPTPELTRVLEGAVEAHQPPVVRGRRIKLRYAHQGGNNPPLIIIHGNRTELLPNAYRRYLINTFRSAFHLKGTPVRVEFRTGANPYEGRKNVLTERQIQKRRRLMKHVKSRKR